MIKIERLITKLQNKYIEHAIQCLSSGLPGRQVSYFFCDIHHFLRALSQGEINARSRNIALVYSNEMEVFILKYVCDVTFIALDMRSNDIFDFFVGNKVFRRIKPFKEKDESMRMRVFFLILQGWDDEKICHSLLITMKKLKEYKSQLTYLFFDNRRNLFYLTLNGFLQREVMVA